jgi:hypothetical protein
LPASCESSGVHRLIVYAVELERDLAILTTDPGDEEVGAVFDLSEYDDEGDLRDALEAREGFWKCVDREGEPTIVTWLGPEWEDLADGYLLPCDYFTFSRDDIDSA